MKKITVLMALLITLFLNNVINADDRPVYSITLTDTGFQPKELIIPPQTRFKIKMKNATKSIAELESFDMHFEKIAVMGKTITVFAGPLRAGKYKFLNDYATSETVGHVVVTAQQPNNTNAKQ